MSSPSLTSNTYVLAHGPPRVTNVTQVKIKMKYEILSDQWLSGKVKYLQNNTNYLPIVAHGLFIFF